MLKATSTAPPPGTTLPDSKVLFATQIESCNDLKSMIKIPFNFVKHIFICASQDNCTGGWLFTALEEDKIVITDCFLNDFFTFSQIWCVENLFALRCGHGANDCGSCKFSDSVHVSFVDPSQADTSCFSHVLRGQVINTHACNDNIGTSLKNFSNSLF